MKLSIIKLQQQQQCVPLLFMIELPQPPVLSFMTYWGTRDKWSLILVWIKNFVIFSSQLSGYHFSASYCCLNFHYCFLSSSHLIDSKVREKSGIPYYCSISVCRSNLPIWAILAYMTYNFTGKTGLCMIWSFC